jgi:5-(carboxyamino)imidazole ribonucleotide synthase
MAVRTGTSILGFFSSICKGFTGTSPALPVRCGRHYGRMAAGISGHHKSFIYHKLRYPSDSYPEASYFVNSSSDNASSTRAPASRVGIIGGGQLGMLLCHAARRLGIHTTVLSDDPAGPTLHVADEALVADLGDQDAVTTLIEKSDVITFELEAIPDVTLDNLREAVQRDLVTVNPGVDTLACLKDKGLQKTWLRDQGLPTLPFSLTDAGTTSDDIDAGEIATPLVQKARQGGYDGKGVQILRAKADLAQLWPVPSVIEPALHNAVEVAVVVARDASGNLSAYPPVTMVFDPGLNAVSTVTSPGALEPDVQEACSTIACDAITALDAVGVFAVELFLTELGELYINEISPRVHNSGHLTIDAFKHDQFEQHMRAITGRPLAPVVPCAPAAVMLNLLYEDSLAPAHTGAAYNTALDSQDRTILHWYGKPEARPGRKMGHITALGMSPETALEHAHEGLVRLRSGDFHPPADAQRAAAI